MWLKVPEILKAANWSGVWKLRRRSVWLMSPWPCLYMQVNRIYGLIGSGNQWREPTFGGWFVRSDFPKRFAGGVVHPAPAPQTEISFFRDYREQNTKDTHQTSRGWFPILFNHRSFEQNGNTQTRGPHQPTTTTSKVIGTSYHAILLTLNGDVCTFTWAFDGFPEKRMLGKKGEGIPSNLVTFVWTLGDPKWVTIKAWHQNSHPEPCK